VKPNRTIIPEPGQKLDFNHNLKSVLRGIVGFADFESSLKPVSRHENGVRLNCQSCLEDGPVEECEHSTTDIHKQVATTYSLLLIDSRGDILFQRTVSSDDDVMEEFLGKS